MFRFTNVNAYNITVTNTATSLTSLIDTAASDNQNIQSQINATLLIAEDGDLRFTTDGSTPTATKGLLLKKGLGAFITGVKPQDIKLVRTGSSNVAVSVSVGQSDQSDRITFFAAGNSFEVDDDGNLLVSEQYLDPGDDENANRKIVEERWNPTYISTATTTVVFNGPGVFKGIVVNGGTAGAITIYDNIAASGTIIASFDSTNALAKYDFYADVAIGLTIVTGAATKLTALTR